MDLTRFNGFFRVIRFGCGIRIFVAVIVYRWFEFLVCFRFFVCGRGGRFGRSRVFVFGFGFGLELRFFEYWVFLLEV